MSATPDLQTAASVISIARTMVDTATAKLAAAGGPDKNQTLAYDLAHVAAAVETARSLVDYGAKGDLEAKITCAFTADMVHDFISRLIGREQLWGVDPSAMAPAHDFVQKYRDPAELQGLAARDPLARMRVTLEQAGVPSGERETIEHDTKVRVDQAIAAARADALPVFDSAIADVYSPAGQGSRA